MTEQYKKQEGETLGSLSQELLTKEPDTLDARELQEEIQGDSYEKELLEALNRAKSKYSGSFYIVVLNQRFRLLANVMRCYFIDRISCPTPDYDQTVYRYHKPDDMLEYLWTIPDKETCEWMRDNPLQVAPDHRELLNYVLDMYEGTLMATVRKLNKEDEQDYVLTRF